MTDDQDLVSLTYVSTARRDLDPAVLLELLRDWRTRNQDRRLTGMLLYRDGNVIQNLEGPVGAVDEVFARIETDPRHSGVLVVHREPVPTRQFDSWSMGFNDVTGVAADEEGWTDVRDRAADQDLGGAAGAVWTLLRVFSDTVR